MRDNREEFDEIIRRLQAGDPGTMETVKEVVRGFAAPAEQDEAPPEPGRD